MADTGSQRNDANRIPNGIVGETTPMPPASADAIPMSPLPPTLQKPKPLPNTVSPAIAPVSAHELCSDKLLLAAPRILHGGVSVPSLGGIPLLAKLGQGGMGAVYYGMHPRLKKAVAVKVLPFHLADQQPELIDRFYREAQIAAKIDSPHLVRVLDVDQDGGLFYLVMEYVSGISAGGYLKQVKQAALPGIDEAIALDICIAAVEGLAAAHAEGIIHRDIKPDNILIPKAKESQHEGGEAVLNFTAAKVADLGLARAEIVGQSVTKSDAAMGTPGFMPPEQGMSAKKAGKPADVFALGATLYALLCGHPPFTGESGMEVLLRTLQHPHPPIQQVRPDISTVTASLIDRCLAKEPAQRYVDASSLLQALKVCRSCINAPVETQKSAVQQLTILQKAAEVGRPVLRNSEPLPLVVDKTLNHELNTSPSASNAAQPKSRAPSDVATVASHNTASRPLVSRFFVAVIVLFAVGLAAYGFWQWREKQTSLVFAAGKLPARAEQAKIEAARIADEERKAKDAETARIADEKQKSEEEQRKREAVKKADDERIAREAEVARIAIEKQTREAAEKKADDERKAKEIETARIEAEKRRAEAHDAEARQSLTTALPLAYKARESADWAEVVVLLEHPLKTLGDLDHPNRDAAEKLLKLANTEQKKRGDFNAKIMEADGLLTAGHPIEAKAAYLSAKIIWPTSPEIGKVDEGVKLADFQAVLREKDPVKHRKRLVELTQAGNLYAAGRMIDLGMFDDMRDLDLKPLSSWRNLATVVQDKTAAQIFADIQANWGTRHPELAKDELSRMVLESRALLNAGVPTNPTVLIETAWLWRDFEPKDPEKAEALITECRKLLARENSIPTDTLLSGSLKHAAAECETPSKSKTGNWNKAADFHKEAARLFEEAGDKKYHAISILSRAFCLQPDNNPSGDWSDAIKLYDEAARSFDETGDKDRHGDILDLQAHCMRPYKKPEGNPLGEKIASPDVDWKKAVSLYNHAAQLHEEARNKVAQAGSMVQEAETLCDHENPDNLNGGHRLAMELYEKAAQIFAEIGDKKNQADALGRLGNCQACANNKDRDLVKAAATLENAARLYGAIGDKKSQAKSLLYSAECLQPPKGFYSPDRWNKAAELYKETSRLMEEVGEKKQQGISLNRLALCQIRNDLQYMTQEAKSLFQRAATLSREAGDEEEAKNSEDWVEADRRKEAEKISAVVTITNPGGVDAGKIPFNLRWLKYDDTWSEWATHSVDNAHYNAFFCPGATSCEISFSSKEGGSKTYSLEVDMVAAQKTITAEDGRKYKFIWVERNKLDLKKE